MQGRANALRTGARVLTAEALTIAGVRGVHMEASAAGRSETLFFVTRWVGEGNRLDAKVTATDRFEFIRDVHGIVQA